MNDDSKAANQLLKKECSETLSNFGYDTITWIIPIPGEAKNRNSQIEDYEPSLYPIAALNVKRVTHLDEVLSKNPHLVSKYDKGWTALHHSVRDGDILTTELLLKHGADVNTKGLLDVTPLWLAVSVSTSDNKYEMTKLLIEWNAEISFQSQYLNGRTAFHAACRYASNKKVVLLLLEKEPHLCKLVDDQNVLPSDILSETNPRVAIKLGFYLASLPKEEGYLKTWLHGMDPIGNSHSKNQFNTTNSNLYGDFLNFYEKQEIQLMIDFMANMIKIENVEFMSSIIENNLLHKTVYNVLGELLKKLIKAEDTGFGIWHTTNCSSSKTRSLIQNDVLDELGYKNLKVVYSDENDHNNDKNRLFNKVNLKNNIDGQSISKKEIYLILWCCLSGRLRLVQLLVRYSRYNVIALGIFTCNILKFTANKQGEKYDSRIYIEKSALACQRIAMNALHDTWMQCTSPSHKWLMQNYLSSSMPIFNNKSIFDMAVDSKCSLVLTQTPLRTLLRYRWYGVLAPINTYWRWITTILMHPIFLPFNLLGLFHFKKYLWHLWNETLMIEPQKKIKKMKQTTKMKTLGREKNFHLSDLLLKENIEYTKSSAQCQNEPWKIFHLGFVKLCRHMLKNSFVKFAQYIVIHIGFLAIFTYVLLNDLHFQPSHFEIYCFIYVLSYGAEEIKEAINDYYKNYFKNYITDKWNICDNLALLLFTIGFFCRYNVIHEPAPLPAIEAHVSSLFWARFFYALSLCGFTMRILFIYTLHDQLGPKLKMIFRMLTKDLLPFIPILFFFVVPYGIAAQALLFPNGFSVDSKEPLRNDERWLSLFSYSFFAMVGDFQLDTLQGKSCDEGSCPSVLGSRLVPYVLLTAYILVTNILLLNLLIALFSKTAESTDEEDMLLSVTLVGRASLVREFKNRSTLAIPLNLVEIVIQLFLWLICFSFKSKPREHTSLKCKCNSNIWKFRVLQAAALRNKRHLLGNEELSNESEEKFQTALDRSHQKISEDLHKFYGKLHNTVTFQEGSISGVHKKLKSQFVLIEKKQKENYDAIEKLKLQLSLIEKKHEECFNAIESHFQRLHFNLMIAQSSKPMSSVKQSKHETI